MNNRRPGFPARLDQAVASPGARSATSAPLAVASTRPAAAKPLRPSAGDRPPSLAMPTGLGMDSAAVRQRMVQKLAAQGVQSPAVLAAMGAVERHRFVDSALVNQAYEDTSLPIGLGQTISKPNVVARMLELLTQAPIAQSAGGLSRVLEIGTGCGYQAAVLSQLAREVYSIERLRGLHEKARDNLRPLRLANLHLLLGDGMLGFEKGAPYAGIVAAAGGEAVPEAWCQQLAMGGRLVAPTVMADGKQALVVIDKTLHGLQQTVLEAVHFVPLKSGIA
ncbi:protein-L-isoaspartate(D-aspartate) O-methyltransferase [Curvibacter sp. RS43]|uniref:Protein-L-isoaspartate O-methyltransferase n=1 Tax=Curvibacter microcysteis TaxID=3026419 RepID=A0ABT5MG41_9BURK|nr:MULTISPECIES: protein-L-isoaspartate(D-aspartate) O-methyltransferase [unclassified Curvibacter]MDD0809681.1 protein-L-isoaspartate(D-aspartate) O-methyltransferase [Curvibacter sp. RS43]MDD0814859.1 protein-L-isoaspartate(D-aspartate) O-methyltransferase [Curvibacter sp. HBC28]